MNLGMCDTNFAQLFLDPRTLHSVIDEQMHGLAEHCGARTPGMSARPAKPPSRDRTSRQAGVFRRIHHRQLLQISSGSPHTTSFDM